jgi:ankyrin repeat protein
LLLEKGVDIYAKNNEGKTALDYAREESHEDIVILLEAAIRDE